MRSGRNICRPIRLAGMISILPAALLLAGCNELGLTNATRAPRQVQDEISLPQVYVFNDERFEDNSQSTPIRTYLAPPGRAIRANEVEVPNGYERDSQLEGELEDAGRFSHSLNLVGVWLGPSPIEDGTCNIIVAAGLRSSHRVVEVEVACVLD